MGHECFIRRSMFTKSWGGRGMGIYPVNIGSGQVGLGYVGLGWDIL